jgi:hypothetical protein
MPTDRGHDAILKWWLERYGDKEEGLALPE